MAGTPWRAARRAPGVSRGERSATGGAAAGGAEVRHAGAFARVRCCVVAAARNMLAPVLRGACAANVAPIRGSGSNVRTSRARLSIRERRRCARLMLCPVNRKLEPSALAAIVSSASQPARRAPSPCIPDTASCQACGCVARAGLQDSLARFAGRSMPRLVRLPGHNVMSHTTMFRARSGAYRIAAQTSNHA